MEYPIIDTLTNAYIRNGWTGLDISTGKNLFNPLDVNTTVFSHENNTFTNIGVDTVNYYRPTLQLINHNTVIATYFSGPLYAPNNVIQTFTINSAYTSIVIKHNGSSHDLRLYYPFSEQGTFTISYYVSSVDPSIVGGLILENIQLEEGSEATPYEPYKPPTTDIFSRTRLPLIRYFPHPVIDSLQRASDGTMTADDVQVLQHYLTKFGIGNIELGRFHAISPNVSNDIREIDMEPIPIDEPIKEKKKTGEEDLNVKTE